MPTIADQRAITQQERSDIGPVASTAADVLGYAGGPGALRGAGRVAEFVAPVTGRYLGGVAGSAAEGAGAGALGTLGHGGSMSDIETNAAYGGALGGATGLLGGVTGPPKGRWLDPTAVPSTADLTATRQQAYGDLGNNIVFKGADVTRAMNNATGQIAQQDIGGIGRARAPDTMSAINSIHDWAASPGPKTPSDLAQLQSDLWDIHRAGMKAGTPDAVYAPIVNKALDDVMANAAPVVGTTGDALLQLTRAKGAFQREANSKMLDLWRQNAAVPGGPSVPQQASSELLSANQTGGRMYGGPQGADYQSLMDLAGSDPGLANKFTIRHAFGPASEVAMRSVATPLIGGAVGGAMGYGLPGGEHENPWERAAIGALAGVGIPTAVQAVSGPLRNAAIQRATNAARQAMVTGVQAPQAAAPVRDALRSLWFGRLATGQGPLNF